MRDVRLEPLPERPSLVSIDDFCSVPEPLAGFGEFVDSLPDIYAGTVFKKLVASIVAARRANRPVVFAMGAHVLKVGLAPLIIDLMRRGVITDVVLNSAGAIHDFELATVGRTSEDVATQLPAGKFGFARETGEALARAAKRGAHPPEGESLGFGRALGNELLDAKKLQYLPRLREHQGIIFLKFLCILLRHNQVENLLYHLAYRHRLNDDDEKQCND